jgi:hypothetical protein
MDAPTEPPPLDPKKVRIGLAMVGVVLVAALVLFFVVDSALGQAVMFAIAAVALVRAYLLSRWLRREGPGARS